MSPTERAAEFSSSIERPRPERAHRARSRRVRLVCHPSEAPSFPGTLAHCTNVRLHPVRADDLETIPCGSSGT